MRQIIIVMLLLIPINAGAQQQRQFYDAAGRNAGRAVTDRQGSTTAYDPAGNVISRSSATGNTTTVYDAAGHRIETVTRPLTPTRR